jgi:hypothetical protein
MADAHTATAALLGDTDAGPSGQAAGGSPPVSQSSSVLPPERPRLRTWQQKLLRHAWDYHFLAGLVFLSILGSVWPTPGMALDVPATSYTCPALVFVVAGLFLKTSELRQIARECPPQRLCYGRGACGRRAARGSEGAPPPCHVGACSLSLLRTAGPSHGLVW